MADFLFGARSPYALTNEVVVDYRQRMNFFYFQDDWKVNPQTDSEPRRALRVRARRSGRRQNRLANFDPAGAET